MKTNILEQIKVILLAISLVVISSQASAQQSAQAWFGNTSVDTKGIPLKGILQHNGEPIANTLMFGEGTNVIMFDGNQNLKLKNAQGKVIAGYSGKAIDPTKQKFGLGYFYPCEIGGKKLTVRLVQEVAEVSYTGTLTLSGSDDRMDTNYKTKGTAVVVHFKSISQKNDKSGDMVNILTVTSDEGKEFNFQMQPVAQFYFTLSDKDEFSRYLISRGPLDEN
jgi:hypothetical protein